jgi:polyferredoxin
MEHLDRPKKLIKYASENNIAKKEKLQFTTRIKAYSVVLLLIVSALVMMLATREEVDITILRTQGMVYQQLPNGYVENLYTARMFNKTHKVMAVQLNIPAGEGAIEILGKQPTIDKESYAVITFLVKKKAEQIRERKTDIHLSVQANGKEMSSKETTFIGPISN